MFLNSHSSFKQCLVVLHKACIWLFVTNIYFSENKNYQEKKTSNLCLSLHHGVEMSPGMEAFPGTAGQLEAVSLDE